MDLVTYLVNKNTPVDDALANYILPTVIDKKVTALSDNIKKMDSLAKKINADTLKVYQTEVKKIFDKNKKQLDELSGAIATFEPQTEAEIKAAAEKKATSTTKEEDESTPKRVAVSSLSLEKQWAFFDDETAKENLGEDNEVVTKVNKPKSLLKIKENIDNLFKEAKKLIGKKASKSAPKKEVAPTPKPIE